MADAAGTRHRVELAGVRMLALLPILAPRGGRLLSAPSGVSLATVRGRGRSERLGWSDSDECGVSAVVLRFTGPSGPLELASRLGPNLRTWRSCLLDWLRALSGHPLPASDNYRRPASNTALIDHGQLLGWSPKLPFRPVHVGATLFWPRRSSRENWRRAVREATRGEPLPLEHALLDSARSALDGGEDRRAVVEAASASEIVMTVAVKRRLARGATT